MRSGRCGSRERRRADRRRQHSRPDSGDRATGRDAGCPGHRRALLLPRAECRRGACRRRVDPVRGRRLRARSGPARCLLHDPGCGRLRCPGGSIDGDPKQEAFLARYARSRKFFGQDAGILTEAGTAATRQPDGPPRGVRGDRRLRRGDPLGRRCRSLPPARPGGLDDRDPRRAPRSPPPSRQPASLLGAIARYAAGSRWLNERYPGESGSWPLVPGVAGVVRDVPVDLLRGSYEEAAFRAVDGLGLVAHVVGYRMSNEAGLIGAA